MFEDDTFNLKSNLYMFIEKANPEGESLTFIRFRTSKGYIESFEDGEWGFPNERDWIFLFALYHDYEEAVHGRPNNE
jgi:hypothetical protein